MAPARFSLHRFEYLRASTESTLLRLAGRWAGDITPPGDPTLVISSSERTLRVTPLPQPPSAADHWIAAYSVPLTLVRGVDARFELKLTESARIALPHPRERTIGAVREDLNASPVRASRAPATPPVASRSSEVSRRTENLWAVLREQIATSLAERAELVERIERESDARAALAEEVSRQRLEADVRRRAEEEARRAQTDAQQALAQAQAELARAQREARDQLALERRVTELEADLAEARRVAETAREAEREAQHEYEAARSEVDVLARTAEDRLVALKKASRRIGDLRDRLAVALAARVEAERRRRDDDQPAAALAKSLQEQLAQANSAASASREQAAHQLEELWATLNAERARSSELESSWRESAEEAETLRERVAALEAVNGQLFAGVEDGERRLDQVGELAATFRDSLAAVRPERPRFARDASELRHELDERVERLAELESEAERLRSAVHAQAGGP
jgi:chromosome segregation ATPase